MKTYFSILQLTFIIKPHLKGLSYFEEIVFTTNSIVMQGLSNFYIYPTSKSENNDQLWNNKCIITNCSTIRFDFYLLLRQASLGCIPAMVWPHGHQFLFAKMCRQLNISLFRLFCSTTSTLQDWWVLLHYQEPTRKYKIVVDYLKF